MESQFRAIIVDDEKLARVDLKNVLSSFEEIQLVGEANNVSSAELLIEKEDPNLVFLDIQLRGESGFDLLEKIDIKIDVVFVTAYDSYAIRAFEANALDYLLKPVSTERLRKTIDKLIERSPEENGVFRRLHYDDVIFLLLNSKYKFLKIDSIVAITSNADYTFIHTDDNSKLITRKTMKEWENRLPINHFCRIHRETIVNLDFITDISEWFSNSYKVTIKGFENPFLMSKRYAALIRKKFK